ncbi:MAG: hypothetical protein R2747_22320 [Pyrinomonadaceae bacterium]
MNLRFNLKYAWLTLGVLSLVLLAVDWFGYGSAQLQSAILALNILGFILSAPAGLFFIPISLAANHFLEIGPFSGEGIYLNTLFLFAIGAMQWFWLERFWFRTEPPFQMLGLLTGGKAD